MRILQDQFAGETPLVAEGKWIKHFLGRGIRLLNVSQASPANEAVVIGRSAAEMGRRGGQKITNKKKGIAGVDPARAIEIRAMALDARRRNAEERRRKEAVLFGPEQAS